MEILDQRRRLKEATEIKARIDEVGEENLTAEEGRKLMEVSNKYGDLYYAYGETSSEWVVNGVELDYSGIDCGRTRLRLPVPL